MSQQLDPGLAADDEERYEEEDALGTDDEDPGEVSDWEDGDIDILQARSKTKGILGRTEAMRHYLASLPHETIAEKMAKVIGYMAGQGLDVTTFLHYMSWNLDLGTSSSSYRKVKYARTALMHSDLLPGILERWYWPPRKHEEGIRTRAARKVMERWAEENVRLRMNREMRLLKPLTLSPPEELSEESLLSLNLQGMAQDFQDTAPVTWGLLRAAACTPAQLQRNTYKDPTAVRFYSFCCFTGLLRHGAAALRHHEHLVVSAIPSSLQVPETYVCLSICQWNCVQGQRHDSYAGDFHEPAMEVSCHRHPGSREARSYETRHP